MAVAQDVTTRDNDESIRGLSRELAAKRKSNMSSSLTQKASESQNYLGTHRVSLTLKDKKICGYPQNPSDNKSGLV